MGKKRAKKFNRPDRDSLAGMIAARVSELNLTAYRVAKMSGVDVSVIQRLIDGDRSPTLETADRICKALDLVLMIRPGSTLALDLQRERADSEV
jgi:plasmid maintenance system antidote protein VapI